jgi:hypothetical protein
MPPLRSGVMFDVNRNSRQPLRSREYWSTGVLQFPEYVLGVQQYDTEY